MGVKDISGDDLTARRQRIAENQVRFWMMLGDLGEIEGRRAAVARCHGSYEIATVNREGLPEAAARYRAAVMHLNQAVAATAHSWDLDEERFRYQWTLSPIFHPEPEEQ